MGQPRKGECFDSVVEVLWGGPKAFQSVWKCLKKGRGGSSGTWHVAHKNDTHCDFHQPNLGTLAWYGLAPWEGCWEFSDGVTAVLAPPYQVTQHSDVSPNLMGPPSPHRCPWSPLMGHWPPMCPDVLQLLWRLPSPSTPLSPSLALTSPSQKLHSQVASIPEPEKIMQIMMIDVNGTDDNKSN